MTEKSQRINVTAGISLALTWDPRRPVDPRDVPAVEAFIQAWKNMMRIGNGNIKALGDTSLLEQAIASFKPIHVNRVRQKEVMRQMLEQSLSINGGNRAATARDLGLTARTIHNMLKRNPDIEARFPARNVITMKTPMVEEAKSEEGAQMPKKVHYWRKGDSVATSSAFEEGESKEGWREVDLEDLDDDQVIQLGDGNSVLAKNIDVDDEDEAAEDDEDDDIDEEQKA